MTPPSIPDYSFRALIGEGSTGRVFAAEYGGQTLMALKAFNPEAINRQLISDALVKVYNGEEHPGIVTIHDFDLASPQAYVATSLHGEPYQDTDGREAIRPRTIAGLLGHLIAEDAWKYIYQIADALAYLHRLRIVHANLEPANVLLDGSTPPHVQLTDFSQGLIGSAPNLIPGESVFYAPPEQIQHPEQYFRGSAERWDVYAFGVLAYQLLTGEFPRLKAAIKEIHKRQQAALDVHFNYDYTVLADMIVDQKDYEWPEPAADDDESARRAIIDRCLEVEAGKRFPDMREVLLAFDALVDEQARREEHRKFAAEQVELDKKVGGMKKISALLGVLALGGLGGAAYFSQQGGGGGGDNNGNGGTTEQPDEPIKAPPKEIVEPAVSETELAELESMLGKSIDDVRESQAAIDEIMSVVLATDDDGNPVYDLPEDTRGLLLNYYEDFAAKHAANPALAIEAARAENNAGEIHLSIGDGEAAIPHLERSIAKLKSLSFLAPDDTSLIVETAVATQNLAEAEALANRERAASDSAMAAYTLWEKVQKRNPDHGIATRKLADSLTYLGERMLAINRPADTGLHVQRAKTILLGLEEKKELTADDVASLARCDYLIGQSEKAKGNLGDAIDLQIQAVDRLLGLKDGDQPMSRTMQYSLATYYGELADTLAENGNRAESQIANVEAIKLISSLVTDVPGNPNYHFALASRQVTKSALLRDSGKGKDARDALSAGIRVMEEVLKTHSKRYDIAYEKSLAKGDLMDLYDEADLKQEAIDTGGVAVKEMQDLLNDDLDIEKENAKRLGYRLALGRLRIRYAAYFEKYGYKDHAIDSYQRGAQQLETLVTASPGNTEVEAELSSVQAKIKALGG